MVVNFKLLIIRVSFPLSVMGLASNLRWTKLSCCAVSPHLLRRHRDTVTAASYSWLRILGGLVVFWGADGLCQLLIVTVLL